MKTGKRSERGKLRQMDSQKESSTGALEGTAKLGPRKRQGRGSASAQIRHTKVQRGQSPSCSYQKRYVERLAGTRLARGHQKRTPGGAHLQTRASGAWRESTAAGSIRRGEAGRHCVGGA